MPKIKKAMFILKFRPGMKYFHVFFFLFFIPEWNFIPVFLTGMNSSPDEISSRQKRVNGKRHLTIDRDDFIPRRVSSRDEISRVSTLLYSINWPNFIFWLRLLLEILGNMCTRFFYKQRFFSAQPQCCLTFKWIEPQMLLIT